MTLEQQERPKYQNPEIQSPLEFVSDFARHARSSKERVWAQCMDVEMGHAPGIILHALGVAAKHGADVRLTMDDFATVIVNDRIKAVPKFGEDALYQRFLETADKEMFQELEKDGVLITVTNRSKLASVFPFIGRNHMKIFIADNTVWFGGVNIASDHFEKADFMVKIQDKVVANELAEVFSQVNENKPEHDYEKRITDGYTLLVDRGDRGKSIILDEALHMIDGSEETISYISQLPPSGEVLKRLIQKANLGVKVDVITQSVKHLQSNRIPFGLLAKRSFLKFQRETADAQNISMHHFEGHHGKVHAKMILVDGKEALWGSHNLDEAGVKVGTQEVSLKTTNPQLIEMLGDWFEGVKNGSYNLGFQKGPLNSQS